MKRQDCILNLIPICAFNVIYFLWQPFNKHILPLFGTGYPISDTVTNVIYFGLWFALIEHVGSCLEDDAIANSKMRKIQRIVLFFAIQLMSDIFKFFARGISDFNFAIFSAVLDVAVFVSILIVSMGGKTTFRKKSKVIAIFTMIILLSFIWFVYECITINVDMNYMEQKYLATSLVYSILKNNCIFRYEFTTMIFESIAFGVIYVAMFCLSPHTSRYNEPTNRKNAKFVFKVMAIVWGLVFINIKMLIIPQSSLTGFEFVDSSSYTNTTLLDIVDIEVDETCLSRYSPNNENYVYQGAKVILKYGDAEVDSFRYHYSKSYEIPNEGSALYKCSISSHTCDDGTKFQTYADQVITFVKDSKPTVVFLGDIVNMEKDEYFIKICKKMILEGDWNYFESCAGYLLEYDKDFIFSYIVAYSEGDFTELEKELPCNVDIKTEYIQKVANELAIRGRLS